ncbi:hypothetical protein K474DRAFT_185796 [Panus rudis PR-1116 ss-1]|nr:hypothetical protein K474DRAFT_185796 [Panus rudis PR-1116 ss-1]
MGIGIMVFLRARLRFLLLSSSISASSSLDCSLPVTNPVSHPKKSRSFPPSAVFPAASSRITTHLTCISLPSLPLLPAPHTPHSPDPYPSSQSQSLSSCYLAQVTSQLNSNILPKRDVVSVLSR